MDCGIPFCHQGCPLGNIIPDWNDLVYRDRWQRRSSALHATNNFPEFTGRICPAPCEKRACSASTTSRSRSSTSRRRSSTTRSTRAGSRRSRRAARTGKRVAVVGSGPAGLAAARAAQPRRAPRHRLRARRPHRRAAALRHPRLQAGEAVRRSPRRADGGRGRRRSGPASTSASTSRSSSLRRDFDAIVLCGGATRPRDLPSPAASSTGIHFAMEYLPQQNKLLRRRRACPAQIITAEGKHVIILGGGDTGRRLPRHRAPPGRAARCTSSSCCRGRRTRAHADNPWPHWPMIFRTSAAHEEGGERDYAITTKRFSGDGRDGVKRLHGVGVEMGRATTAGSQLTRVPGSEFELDADLCCSRWASSAPSADGLVAQLGVRADRPRQRVARRRLDDQRARRLRRRRHAARAVAGRLGDRRRPPGRRRGGPVLWVRGRAVQRSRVKFTSSRHRLRLVSLEL